MRRLRPFILCTALPLFLAARPGMAENEDLTRFGDIAQIALPATAALVSLLHGDDEGFVMALEGAAYTSAYTHGFKRVVNAPRPNGGEHSWPSGHTSAAAQGAAHLHLRYGWAYGLPAYLTAGLVGYSRVQSNNHYWRDVIAGMALATGVQYALHSQEISVEVAPFIADGWAGVRARLLF